MGFKDDRKESLNKQKQLAIVDINNLFDEIAESPEKLTREVAMKIYNDYPFKRKQIHSIFFSKIKTLEEWLTIYKISRDDNLTKKLAQKNIQNSKGDIKQWILLHESENEDFFKKIAIEKLKENCKDLDHWIFVYENSSYGFETNILALGKIREVSQSYEDWKKAYELAPFGTKTKAIALENLMLTAREKKEEEIIESTKEKKKHQRTTEDWKSKYKNQEDFYSHRKDEALVNLYLYADKELEEKEKKEGEYDTI